jgi:hypothetical protein
MHTTCPQNRLGNRTYNVPAILLCSHHKKTIAQGKHYGETNPLPSRQFPIDIDSAPIMNPIGLKSQSSNQDQIEGTMSLTNVLIEKAFNRINLNPAIGMCVRRTILCVVAGMKTFHAAKGFHPPGECMGQGLVSVASPDPVYDASRLLCHSRHVSSGIHLGLVSDGYPLPTCGYDGLGHTVHPLTPHACCLPTPVG